MNREQIVTISLGELADAIRDVMRAEETPDQHAEDLVARIHRQRDAKRDPVDRFITGMR